MKNFPIYDMVNIFIYAKQLQNTELELTIVITIMPVVHVTLLSEQLSRQSVGQKLPCCLKSFDTLIGLQSSGGIF